MPTAILLVALLTPGMTGATGAAPFTGTVSLQLDGQVIEGQPISWNPTEVHLLGRDGRLWQFPPHQATEWQRVSYRFTPATVSELRAELLRELGGRFEVTTTTHYVVAHAKGQRDQWAERFEGLYREFVTYFSKRGFNLTAPPFPLVGVVLPNEAGFRQYTAASLGSPAPPGLLGFYSLATNRIVLYDLDPSKHHDSWHETATTIIHEATHQTAFNTGIHSRTTPPPLWVAEGLATLFEAPGVSRARYHPTQADRLNRVRLTDFRRLAAHPHGPDRLAAMVASDASFRANPTAAYAEAWALTFYLVETQPAQYARYVALTVARPPFAEYTAAERTADFTSVFGNDWAMLEAQLRRFISSLRAGAGAR